jgi:hypothetical protein
VRPKIFSPTWASPEVVATKKEGREKVARRLGRPRGRDCPQNVLEDFEQIDKSPSKCSQTRDPQTRGQIPRSAIAHLTPFCVFRYSPYEVSVSFLILFAISPRRAKSGGLLARGMRSPRRPPPLAPRQRARVRSPNGYNSR